MRKYLLFGSISLAICAVSLLFILPLYAEVGPIFDIKSPSAGQVFTSPIIPLSVEYRNSDSVPVVRFDCYLDGKRFLGGTFSRPSASGTFETDEKCDITLAKAASGSHTLAVRLTDAQGRANDRTILINYQPVSVVTPNATPPATQPQQKGPIVRFVEPASGASITQKTTIRVETTSASTLKVVHIFLDGKLRAMTTEKMYQFTLDPVADNLAGGSHMLSASAWDIFDNRGDSGTILLDVFNPTQQTLIIGEGTTPAQAMPPGLVLIPAPVPEMKSPFSNRVMASNEIAPVWMGNIENISVPTPVAPTRSPLPVGLIALADGSLVLQQGSPDFTGPTPSVLAKMLNFGRSASPLAPLAPKSMGLLASRSSENAVYPAMVLPGNLLLPETVSAASPRVLPAVNSAMASLSMPKMGLNTAPELRPSHLPSHLLAPQADVMPSTGRTAAQPADIRVGDRVAVPALMITGQNGEMMVVPVSAAMVTNMAPGVVTPRLMAAVTAAGQQVAIPLGATARVPGFLGLGGSQFTVSNMPVLPRALAGETRASASGTVLSGIQHDLAPTAAPVVAGREASSDMPALVVSLPASGDHSAPSATMLSRLPSALTPPATLASIASDLQQSLLPPALAQQNRVTMTPVILMQDTTLLNPVTSNTPADPRDAVKKMPVLSDTIPATAVTGQPAPAASKILPTFLNTPATDVQPAQENPTETPTPVTGPDTEPAPSVDPLAGLRNEYTVKAGDTFKKIASTHETTVNVLKKLNPAVDPEHLKPGMTIRLPHKLSFDLDKTPINTDSDAYIAGKGYTMVSMRPFVEAKGGIIVWVPETRKVNAWVNNNYLGVTIGKRKAHINSEVYMMPIAATIKYARTMVPLRFIAKGMKLQMTHDQESGVYTLTSQQTDTE